MNFELLYILTESESLFVVISFAIHEVEWPFVKITGDDRYLKLTFVNSMTVFKLDSECSSKFI